MSRRAREISAAVFVLIVALTLLTAIMTFVRPVVAGVVPAGPADLGYMFNAVGFGAAGALVARRQPSNRIWMALSAAGLAGSIFGLGVQYVIYAVLIDPGALPGAAAATWVTTWLFSTVPASFALVFLIFPTGQTVSRGWRYSIWLVPVALSFSVLHDAMTPGWPQDVGAGSAGVIQNPLALHGHDEILTALGVTSGTLMAVLFVAALASLVVRYRRGGSQERHQLRWFMFAAPFTPLGFALYPLVASPSAFKPLWIAAVLLQVLAAAGLPLALGIAVLKYRLYDIDIVISRTLVYGALALFVTVVYIAIVVGIGDLIGSGSRPNLVLSVLATAVVAVAFQPVHHRLQRFGNRVVYGKRATPYEVLAEFSAQVADTYAADEVLPRMARLLGEATGAREARVWIRRPNQMVTAAQWPEASTDGIQQDSVAVTGMLMPLLPGVDRAAPIRYQGELLGALSAVKRSGEPLTPVEQDLMDDLALQAGLVLRNVRLTAELIQRLDELRASRQRLVAAQDDERRRLERNLHDGAQQNLVALKIKVNLVGMTMDKDPARARALVEEVKADADETLSTLRDLARGIYPPLLAQMGLAKALEAQATKATIPVDVQANAVDRYTPEVESTVYFCCLEALQNIQKYASASRATVTIAEVDGNLQFSVRDDGVGFDTATVERGAGLQNITDRLDAVGGEVTLQSAPGRGSMVGGRVPVAPQLEMSAP